MKARILLITMLVFALCSMNCLAVISDFGTFKQKADLTLYQTCDNCTYVNISKVISPGAITLVTDKIMTRTDGNTFSYVLDKNYTADLGQYTVLGIGDERAVPTSFSYVFEITPTGNPSTIANFLILVILAFVLFILASLLNNNIIGVIDGILFFVTGVYTNQYGFGYFQTFDTNVVGIILAGLGIIVFFVSVYNYMEEMWGEDNWQEPTEEE